MGTSSFVSVARPNKPCRCLEKAGFNLEKKNKYQEWLQKKSVLPKPTQTAAQPGPRTSKTSGYMASRQGTKQEMLSSMPSLWGIFQANVSQTEDQRCFFSSCLTDLIYAWMQYYCAKEVNTALIPLPPDLKDQVTALSDAFACQSSLQQTSTLLTRLASHHHHDRQRAEGGWQGLCPDLWPTAVWRVPSASSTCSLPWHLQGSRVTSSFLEKLKK